MAEICRKQVGLMQLEQTFKFMLFQGIVSTLEAPRRKGPKG